MRRNWKAIPAEQLKPKQRVRLPDGIKVVAKIEVAKPECLAEVQVTWEGGQVERYCNHKQLLAEEL